jgi:hypothetical protein
MQSLIRCLVVASLVGAGFVARDVIQDEKDAGGMQAEPLTEEHKWLAEGAGKWKAAGKFNMGGNWVPISGVQTNTMQAGGRWQLIEFKDDQGFVGNGISGFDTGKKKFVSVWVDSMSSDFAPAEGTLSADKKTLTMNFTITREGKRIAVTETVTRKDKDTTVFEMMHAGPDGKSEKVLEITYTRM